MTLDQIILATGVHRRTIYRWMEKSGFPRPYGSLSQSLRWKRSEAAAWCATHGVEWKAARISLQEANYLIRVDFMDQITDCGETLSRNCPTCRDFSFVGGSGGGDTEGMYLMPFATADEALLWRMKGHIKKHQLIEVERGGIRAILDGLEQVTVKEAALKQELDSWTRKLNRALPAWERTRA